MKRHASFAMAAFLAAILLLAVFGVVDARAAAERGVLAAMVRFDRTYIPALALSNQGKLEQTKKAMARLQDEWGRFRDEYGSYEGDVRWKEALRRVGDALGEAAMYLGDGELPKMHEVLEERSMDYYVDKLNRYHETMEEVLWAAGEAGTEGLDEAVIKAAQGLRPPYVKAFLMFGDFGGLE
jgi:hypothetical protein